MKVSITGFITNAFQSTKNPQICYFDVMDSEQRGRDQASFSTKIATAADLVRHGMVPMRIEGNVQIRKYDRNQQMEFVSLSVAPVPAAVAAPQPSGVNGSK